MSWSWLLLSSLNFLSWPSRPDLLWEGGGTGTGPGKMTFCSHPGPELEPGSMGESVFQPSPSRCLKNPDAEKKTSVCRRLNRIMKLSAVITPHLLSEIRSFQNFIELREGSELGFPGSRAFPPRPRLPA